MIVILVGRVTQFRLSFEPHQQTSISYHFYSFLYSSRSWIHIFLWHIHGVTSSHPNLSRWYRSKVMPFAMLGIHCGRNRFWGRQKNNLTARFISMYPAKSKWRSDLFSPELDDPYSTLLVKRSFWCIVRLCGNRQNLVSYKVSFIIHWWSEKPVVRTHAMFEI